MKQPTDEQRAKLPKWALEYITSLTRERDDAIAFIRKHSTGPQRQPVNDKIGTDGLEFRAGTGLLGSTEAGQRVTQRNVRQLPPGSVVRLEDGGRLIHLYDEVWLYCSDSAHCYDRIENLKRRLPGTLCHLPPAAGPR